MRTVILSPEQRKKIGNTLLVQKFRQKGHGINSHSLHLLNFFGEVHDSKAELPSFSFIEYDSSMRRQQLILNQCIQQSELNWSDLHHEWQLFPHSLEFLMHLLQTYYQPFKLIMCISTHSLYNLLRNSKDNFGSVRLRFEEELLQHKVNETINHLYHII